MIRFMLDTDVLRDLTGHAELLATYSDLVPNPVEEAAHYPHSDVVLIDRGIGDPSGTASILDIETGAASIGDAPTWYDTQHARGIKYLTVYVNRANMGAVSQAMGDRPHFQWVATLDGTLHLPQFNPLHTPAAIQCLSEQMLGYHADGSLVLEDAWHPQPFPVGNAVLRRDLTGVIGITAHLSAELHRIASVLGG